MMYLDTNLAKKKRQPASLIHLFRVEISKLEREAKAYAMAEDYQKAYLLMRKCSMVYREFVSTLSSNRNPRRQRNSRA
jgi:hypothetical protein